MSVGVTHRPTRLGGATAIGATLLASWLVLPSVAEMALLVVGVGALCLVVGDAVRVRGSRLGGVVVGVVGVGIALGGVALGVSEMSRFDGMARVGLGTLGVITVALGVFPLRGDGARGLLKAGTALVFLSFLVAGVLKLLTLETMVIAVVALVVAVDLGERAIGLGEQLGREADTAVIEAGHGVATLSMGALAVGVGQAAPRLGGGALSLSGLVLLLLATLALAVALFD